MKNTRVKMKAAGLCALLVAVMTAGPASAAPLVVFDSRLISPAEALLTGAEEAGSIEAAITSALEEETEASVLLVTSSAETEDEAGDEADEAEEIEADNEAADESGEAEKKEASGDDMAESDETDDESETDVATEADVEGFDSEEVDETVSEYEDIAICQANSYVNIRSEANAKSEILGKIYTDAAATILETVEADNGSEWYYISSGSVKGYVNAKYFVSGEAAEEIAGEAGTTIATVKAITLRLRSKATTESSTLSLLAKAEEYEVIDGDESDDFVKITVDDDLEGYVSTDYVELEIVFEEAVSLEEEAEEEAEAAAEATESSSGSSSSSSSKSSSNSSSSSGSSSSSSSSTSSLRSSIVSYAKSFVGKLDYVYGGSSLTTGADCSGFVQAIYAHFGISLPRTSSEQGSSGKSVSSSNIQPGDLVYYGGHIAIYIGNGQVVHASTEKTGVKISDWNYKTPVSIRNVID